MTQMCAAGAQLLTVRRAVIVRAASVSIFLLLALGCLAGIGAQRADASKGRVLVVAQRQTASGALRAAADLRSLGYPVIYAETSTLPEELAQYSAIWYIGLYAIPQADQEALEQYVRNGGNLYLTGERPCCEALNGSDTVIARALLKNQQIVVGHQGDPASGEASRFNSQAADGIATTPNALNAFPADGPGGIGGIGDVTSRNVLASDGQTALAGVFDESDMANGRGRLVIYMDWDWLVKDEPEEAARLAIVQNIQDFLAKNPKKAPAHTANENVLVLATHENVKDGLDATAALRSLGYKVTLSVAPSPKLARRLAATVWQLPKLKKYGSVWSMMHERFFNEEEEAAIESYVADGGRLYLGSNPYSPETSTSPNQSIVRAVLMNQQVAVKSAGIQSPMEFNTGALDSIAAQPNALGSMPTSAAGELYGVEPRNVLARSGDAVTAAAFDETDMSSGRGRLVVYPDEWPSAGPDPVARNSFVENVEDFLEGTPNREPRRTAEYVGLGDSYAAGVGSFEYIPGTAGDGGCYRAVNGYVPRIAADDHMTVAFQACLGAVIENLWEPRNERSAQLNFVGPDTRAITLTIGGNNVGFAGVLKACILPHPRIPRPGGPLNEGCAKGLEAAATEALGWLLTGRDPGKYKLPGGGPSKNEQYRPSLQQLYESILYQAPGAELVVIGYPRLFETGRAPGDFVSCDVLKPLSVRASDVRWINERTDQLDATIEETVRAVQQATGRQIRFADPRPAFTTHGLCDTGDAYFSPLLPDPEIPLEPPWKLNVGKLLGVHVESFHPTAEGQEALRELIEDTADEF
jgi:GDSL-like Lipase/Acylhydrolase family